MNINENLKMREKTLGKLVFKGLIRPKFNTLDILLWVYLFNGTIQMPKNIVQKNKSILIT